QSPRAFVERLDFRSSVAQPLDDESAGVTVVVTDVGTLEPDPDTRELALTAVHPDRTVADAREATGWDLRVADDLAETPPPTPAGTRRRSTRTSRAQAAAEPTTRAGTASSRSSRARTRGATTTTRGGPRTSTSRSSAARSPSGS